MNPVERVIALTEALLLEKSPVILALDGMAAAGKTTEADELSAYFRAPVVRMDDFFLPQPLRTPERLSEPGGNVHYERFAAEVLPGLTAGRAFDYRRFDCGLMAYGARVLIPAAPVVIVEGAYAMHPCFGKYWDLGVFFAVSPEEQERRIRRRNGAEGWERFRTRWIPLENRYHAACRTAEQADIVITAAPLP